MTKQAKSQNQKTKSDASSSRKLATPKYRSFRISKRIKQTKPALTGGFRLFYRSLLTLKNGWKLLGGIALIYLLVSLLLVRGLSVTIGAGEIKDALQQLFGGGGQVAASVTVFGLLLGSAGASASDAASVYQTVFLIVFSLAFIWALRQYLSEKTQKIRIRDAFYRGMYPLVPVVLVLLVIGLQLVPLYVSGFLYSAVFGTGLAVTVLEQVLWAILLFLLALLSLYLVSSSIIALYIATLPNVTPMQALRSSRDLVRHRRWIIMRKVFFLPVAMITLAGIIVVPLIMLSPTLAEWVFLGLSALALPIVHTYLYSLYRELL